MPKYFSSAAGILLATCLGTCVQAQNAASGVLVGPTRTSQVSFTYQAQRSIVTGSGNPFWMHGITAEDATALIHGLSVAGDFTFDHTGSTGKSGTPLDLLVFAAGPRFTFRPSLFKASRTPDVFVQGLFGAAHGFDAIFPNGSGTQNSATSFAMVLGGGFDLRATHHLGVRLIQADYLRSYLPNGAAEVQNSLRLSAGITVVFRQKGTP